MNLFKNMKLGAKIFSLVGVLLLLIAVVGWSGISNMHRIGDEIKAIAHQNLPLTSVVTDITTNQLKQAVWLERASRFGEVMGVYKKAIKGFEEAKDEFNEHSKRVDKEGETAQKMIVDLLNETEDENERKVLKKNKEQLKAIIKTHAEYEKYVREIFGLFEQGKIHEAKEILDKTEEIEEKLNIEIEKFVQQLEKNTENSVTKAVSNEQQAVIIILIAGVVAMVLGFLIAFLVVRGIVTALKHAVAVSQRLSEGDLTVNVESTSQDETGQLLEAMGIMVGGIREVVEAVQGVSNNVVYGSEQLSSTTQWLSQGTTKQAVSVKEINTNIQQKADHARQMAIISQRASQDAEKSGRIVNKAVHAMREIAGKISVIEEISYQTNVLALKATFEAARAGEQGDAVAIVAAEIRKLAEKSQSAAREISQLSKSTMTVSQRAGKMLKNIVPEISAAGNERNSGARQISAAVIQLNQVTQQNASATKEMASTTEALSSQAQLLQEAFGFFKLKGSDRPKIRTRIAAAHTSPAIPHLPNVSQPANTPTPSRRLKQVTYKKSSQDLTEELPGVDYLLN